MRFIDSLLHGLEQKRGARWRALEFTERQTEHLMAKTTTMNIEIRFGDCDPAGIVFFPRYHRWMDAASLQFFMECGVPPWHVLETTSGIIGTPLLEHHARFYKSATYGERLTITTHIERSRGEPFPGSRAPSNSAGPFLHPRT